MVRRILSISWLLIICIGWHQQARYRLFQLEIVQYLQMEGFRKRRTKSSYLVYNHHEAFKVYEKILNLKSSHERLAFKLTCFEEILIDWFLVPQSCRYSWSNVETYICWQKVSCTQDAIILVLTLNTESPWRIYASSNWVIISSFNDMSSIIHPHEQNPVEFQSKSNITFRKNAFGDSVCNHKIVSVPTWTVL